MSFSSKAESHGSPSREQAQNDRCSEDQKESTASSPSRRQRRSDPRQERENNEAFQESSLQNDVETNIITTEPMYDSFDPRFKTTLVILVSAVATLSGLSSNVYFPAQTDIANVSHSLILSIRILISIFKGLRITPEVVNLSITTYMIAQGLAPSFWSVYADHKGRRVTFLLTLTIYLGANIALALSVDGTMLLIFRALQAIGSSSTIALGAGVIADIFPAEKRGAYIGWFSGSESMEC